MSTAETSRLFVFVSLEHAAGLPALHRALQDLLKDNERPASFAIHLAARHFPSTWGRVSHAQPVQPDPLALAPEALKEWQSWFGAGRLRLVPAGFAGALGAVLDRDELKAELAWAQSNSWKSGFKDCFGAGFTICLPFWPLPGDPASRALAAERYGVTGLGCLHANGGYLVVLDQGEPAALPLVELETAGRRGLAGQIRDSRRRHHGSDLAVHAVFTAPDSAGGNVLQDLAAALDELAAEGLACTGDPRFRPLAEFGLDPAAGAPGLPGELQPLARGCPVPGPDFRDLLRRLPEGRRGRSATQERLRSQLLTCLPHDSAWRLPVEAAPELPRRSLLANMEGEASVMSDGYEARFDQGNWLGFFSTVNPALPPIRLDAPTGPGLRCGGTGWFYEIESSVSFETDNTRGLRNAQVLKLPDCRIPGRAMTDYVLTDHGPHLLIDVQIRYPWVENAATIEELAPYRLAFGLPAGCQDITISWQHLKDQRHEFRLDGVPAGHDAPAVRDPRQTWWQRLFRGSRGSAAPLDRVCRFEKVFFGHQWTVTWEHGGQRQGIALFRLPEEQGASAPLELRLCQDAGGRNPVLELYPEGHYRQLPAHDMRSLNHHFVLGLLPVFGAADTVCDLPPRNAKECASFYLVRES